MIYAHKIEKGNIKGQVKIDLFPFVERTNFAKEIMYEIAQDGVSKEREGIDQAKMLVSVVKERVKEVNISCEGTEVLTFDDLLYYKEGLEIANEIGSILLSGISLEKK
jgi:hypothetical protein